MPVVPPQEWQVTIQDGGEPHIVPLKDCPKCQEKMCFLSINNGFTGKFDDGRLQQSVWNSLIPTSFTDLVISTSVRNAISLSSIQIHMRLPMLQSYWNASTFAMQLVK